jgi:ketosteroid isomerase-like protein
MRTIVIAMALLAASAVSSWAGPAETAKTADAYLAAYERLDLAALAPMYADDAVFADPTSYGQPNLAEPFTFIGKTKVLEGLQGFKSKYGLTRLKYSVTTRFDAPNQTVYIGTVASVVKTPKGERSVVYPAVTIVTVTNGKISEHRDYIDYPAGKPAKVPD